MLQLKARKILVFAEHFAPAYKAGGIVRSLENLVMLLEGEYEFAVVTSNTNLHRHERMENIVCNQWTKFNDRCNVIYLSGERQTISELKKIIRFVNPECVYINGIFSPFFTLSPLLLIKFFSYPAKVILAPRGMLHKGNLRMKRFKKNVFFFLFKLGRFHKQICWHSTDLQEKEDILQMFGRESNVVLAHPLPTPCITPLTQIRKTKGQLLLATISLIAYKKGHLQLLKTLKALQNKVSAELHIYGPVKDQAVWQCCQKEIEQLKNGIKVVYHGFVHPEEVAAVLGRYHFFVLLSQGENFCHAAYESLRVGRPLIISDQTPWRNLEVQHAGWDINLYNQNKLFQVLEHAHDMDQATYDELCQGAQSLAKRFLIEAEFKQQYETLFH